jgi:hypothetical protein
MRSPFHRKPCQVSRCCKTFVTIRSFRLTNTKVAGAAAAVTDRDQRSYRADPSAHRSVPIGSDTGRATRFRQIARARGRMSYEPVSREDRALFTPS